MMNLQSTDFELFDVPRALRAGRARAGRALEGALQREVHPDRFAAQGAAAQRVAAQWSARINEAYRRLKDPLRRAAYLCELRGAPIQAENNTAMPPAFLMQQMAWRERWTRCARTAGLDAMRRGRAHAARAAVQEIEQAGCDELGRPRRRGRCGR
jgi:molecular chaperone HscB